MAVRPNGPTLADRTKAWSGREGRVALLVLGSGLLAGVISAATFVVDSTGDEADADVTDGLCRTALDTCTLRAAIEQANALAGADTIAFNIPGAGVHTIGPASPLPALTDDAGVTIDGYTQPGSSPNTLSIGNDAVLTIEIDGTAAGPSANGLTIQGLAATVRGLVINRFAFSGIAITSGYGHQVGGCFLGTDPTGTIARGNRNGLNFDRTGSPLAVPVKAAFPPPVLLVGGLNTGDRNLLSGNSSAGMEAIFTTNCVIQNNYVGTDASGEAALPNQGGGVFLLAENVTLGGGNLFDVAGRYPGANVVSGNVGSGILLFEGGENSIAGNIVGTDARGLAAVPNGIGINLVLETADGVAWNLVSGNSSHGIRFFVQSRTSIFANRIGTDLTGNTGLGNKLNGVTMVGRSFGNFVGPNTIAYNGGSGVSIGGNASDTSNDNRVFGNSIHDNGGLGIDLGDDGVTPNNDCDNGRGPNLLQNFPVLTSASPSGGSTTITGTLNSIPNSTFSIDFFQNALCDPSGYGQGETYLGEIQVTTDAFCNASFEAVFPVSVAPGSVVTATATDTANNTSEFSACRPVTVGQGFYTVTPCRVADTRNEPGPSGGPALTANAIRTFPVANICEIPPSAKAIAINLAVTAPNDFGDLRVYPAGEAAPLASSISFRPGIVRASNAIIALSASGEISVQCDMPTGSTHFFFDVYGYFQ
jgi:CSLREA domain-containing protein